jgi:hypothetical protein
MRPTERRQQVSLLFPTSLQRVLHILQQPHPWALCRCPEDSQIPWSPHPALLRRAPQNFDHLRAQDVVVGDEVGHKRYKSRMFQRPSRWRIPQKQEKVRR